MADSDRAIVFDLYGVLALHQDPAAQRTIEDLLGVPRGEHARLWDAYWARRAAYDRGDVDAATWWTGVAADVDRAPAPAVVDRLVRADVESWSRFDGEMVALVEQLLDQGRTLALLSNAPLELAGFVRSGQAWLGRFAAVVFSGETRAAKPEPAAYAAVEAALGRGPEQLLMVDDRAENVTAARERGWTGLVFTDRSALLAAL